MRPSGHANYRRRRPRRAGDRSKSDGKVPLHSHAPARRRRIACGLISLADVMSRRCPTTYRSTWELPPNPTNSPYRVKVTGSPLRGRGRRAAATALGEDARAVRILAYPNIGHIASTSPRDTATTRSIADCSRNCSENNTNVEIDLAVTGSRKPRTMLHLGLVNWTQLARQPAPVLQRTLAECARWEHEVDPDGRLLPRAKVSDDKALACVVL